MPTPRVRRSLTELQDAYDNGDKAPLEALIRAWKGIKALPAGDLRSFFVLGGYHGEPFRGPGRTDGHFWGGYCMHGNVLFPIWHRLYLLALEDALRSIPGCADVTLPFWDECSPASLAHGIPRALTDETFVLDGKTIANPLRSFVFPVDVVDALGGDHSLYSKPKGYETVRYPFSGLVGTPAQKAKTAKHNAQWTYEKSVGVLNRNISAWLKEPSITVDGKSLSTNVERLFEACLNAPNYTLFSNTTSANAFNHANGTHVVPLERPHNMVHLAIGGFDVPKQGDFDVIPGANGDMGENDTAGLDPIFFLHHCFIDRVFWLWQQGHAATDALVVEAGAPGTSSSDAQGPTPQIKPGTPLSMDTPLAPFKRADGSVYAGKDGVNIETQLGYTYGPGSLTAPAAPHTLAAAVAGKPARTVHVSSVDRSRIEGSFLIVAYAQLDGERTPIGIEAVLSRWHVDGCANCQTHLDATATFPLPEALDEQGVEVEVRTRAGLLGGRPHTLALAADEAPPFTVDVG